MLGFLYLAPSHFAFQLKTENVKRDSAEIPDMPLPIDLCGCTNKKSFGDVITNDKTSIENVLSGNVLQFSNVIPRACLCVEFIDVTVLNIGICFV